MIIARRSKGMLKLECRDAGGSKLKWTFAVLASQISALAEVVQLEESWRAGTQNDYLELVQSEKSTKLRQVKRGKEGQNTKDKLTRGDLVELVLLMDAVQKYPKTTYHRIGS